jgi:hypothetical protein
MRWLILAPVLLIFAVAGTYVRYQSFDTCRWLVVDTAHSYDLPETAAQAKARADLLLHGVIDADSVDCLHAWWRVRRHMS